MIEHSIVGAGVQIKEGSRVERGCLIADRVTIGPQAKLERFQKLFKRTQGNHEEEEEKDVGEEKDSEAGDEEDDNDDDESATEDDASDYDEIEASKYHLKSVCPIPTPCFRSESCCFAKTWARIQRHYMA